MRGYIKINIEDYEGAIKDFSKAIELDPENPEHFKGRGNAKDLKDDIEGAKLDFDKAGELGDEEAKQWSKDLIESNEG